MFLISFFSGSYSLVGRAISAILLGGIFSVFFGHIFITRGSRFIRSGVREFVTDLHAHKDQTPTMGGLPMVVALVLALLCVGALRTLPALLFVGAILGFGIIGFLDDFYKIRYKKGISETAKSVGQLFVSSLLISVALGTCTLLPTVVIPFFGYHTISMGLFFVPWALFILVGVNNAVNLTDGLDGLAASLLIVNFLTLGFVALCSGYFDLFICALAACGVLSGFLWFNTHPAQIFMGDVGALGFGGALAIMALITKSELLLPFSGIIFVVETFSVMIQVFMVKRFHKRIFKMAPLHHHLELFGVPETRIVARFVLITIFSSLIALVLSARSVCAV